MISCCFRGVILVCVGSRLLVVFRADREKMQLTVETEELGTELEQLAKAKVS